MTSKRQTKRIFFPAIFIPFLVLTIVIFGNQKKAYADLLNDGDWDQSGAPGTTTITFNNTGALTSGDFIVLSFPSTADVDAAGVDINVTGQTSPVRTNDDTDNTITIELDGNIVGDTTVSISMSDALTSYTSTTYALDSVGINTQDSTYNLIDYGLAIIDNDNTTTVTASVPLFVTMAIDTTSIDLGTLSSASVAEADQTYTFNSNNQTGITVQIATDGLLNDGSGNDIDYLLDTSVSAGQEEYGIIIDNTVPSLTINANYAPDDNPIIQAANDIATSDGPVSSATFDINYKASISGSTVAGDYDQVVTVTVATKS